MRHNSESPLQTLRELIGTAFHGSSVKRVADVLRFSPLSGFLIQEFHNLDSKVMTGRSCMAASLHSINTLAKPSITKRDRAVVVIQQLINRLPFCQSADRAILPKDRCNIRWGSYQGFMPDA